MRIHTGRQTCRFFPLCILLFVFLMLCPVSAATAKTASGASASTKKTAADPDVVSRARKKSLKNAVIVQSGKHLVCEVNGSVLKKKEYWFSIGKNVYYLNKKGYVAVGEFRYKDHRYRADSEGKLLIRKFFRTKEGTYYFGKTGAMVTDRWITISGSKRYFLSSGYMAVNQWVDEHFVGYDGCIVSALTRVFEPWSPSSKELGWHIKATDAREKHLVIIGASRVVYLSRSIKKNRRVHFIASRGKGIRWFCSYGLPVLEQLLEAYPDCNVVFQLGNNDLLKMKDLWKQYRKTYSQLISDYPKAHFYFMDILPASPDKNDRENLRLSFNSKLKKAFPKQYIGGYQFLVNSGYTCIDAVHYDDATNKKIYSYILKKIRW